MMHCEDNPVSISEEALSSALDLARARITECEQQRAGLDKTISVAREEVELLMKLIALKKGGTAGQTESKFSEAALISPSAGFQSIALTAAIEELEAAGRPLHISELMRLLRKRNVPIPGAGTQANLITHLRRDSRLARPSRGMYGLASWGLENMPASARRRKRRVRLNAKKEGR